MDEDLQALQREIEDLTEVLRDLGRTVLNVDDAFIAKFGKAVGKSTKSFDENTKAIAENTKAMNKGIVVVDKWGREVEDSTKIQKDANRAAKEELKAKQEAYVFRRKERDAFETLSQELGSTAGVGRRVTDALQGVVGSGLASQNALRLFLATIQGSAKALVSMTKDVYAGKRGAAVSAKALNELAQTVGTVAQGIGLAMTFIPGLGIAARIAGMAIGAFGASAKVAGDFNELAAEQADALFKSFRELSKVGAATSMDQVFESLQLLGMTGAEIEDFNRLIKENAQTLARFGASAAEGGKEFAKVAGGLYKSDLGYQLEMLGISAQEQREAALTYMSIQSRTGQLQLRSTGQLIEESAKFARELDLAAKITGQTREEQAKAREAAMSEERYRSAVIAARMTGDQQQLAMLQRAGEIAGILRAFGDVRGATGVLQAAAGGGALTTPEAIAAEMTYGISQILSNPNQPLPEALKALRENAKYQTESLADVTRLTGGIEGIQTNVVAIDDFVTRMAPIIDAAQKSGMSLSEFLQSEQGRRMIQGGDTKEMTEAGRKQQSAAMTMDSVVKSFNAAAKINAAASAAFDGAVRTFARTVGAPGPAGGTPGGAPGAGPAPAGGAQGPGTGVAQLRGAAAKNRNPGNLRFIGQKGATQGTGGFAAFETVDDGLVALANDLNAKLTGRSAHGKLDTVESLISKYAPPNENDTKAYIAKVSAFLGVDPGAKISNDPKTLAKLMTAIIGVESFGDPSKGYGFRNGVQFGVAQALNINPGDVGSFRMGGIATGPKSGYASVMHGTEAVIPMPNGQSIPIEMPQMNENLSKQVDIMMAQMMRLDEMVNAMKEQNSISKRILQVTHA